MAFSAVSSCVIAEVMSSMFICCSLLSRSVCGFKRSRADFTCIAFSRLVASIVFADRIALFVFASCSASG
eukprot:2743800-Alexandrium_andersonii.AAC.1